MHQGDISPAEAYQRLQNNSAAVLIDVRTQPEWVFVGVPAVERLIRLSWQVFPAMQVNAQFVAEIEQMGLPKDTRNPVHLPFRRKVGIGGFSPHPGGLWQRLERCAGF